MLLEIRFSADRNLFKGNNFGVGRSQLQNLEQVKLVREQRVSQQGGRNFLFISTLFQNHPHWGSGITIKVWDCRGKFFFGIGQTFWMVFPLSPTVIKNSVENISLIFWQLLRSLNLVDFTFELELNLEPAQTMANWITAPPVAPLDVPFNCVTQLKL